MFLNSSMMLITLNFLFILIHVSGMLYGPRLLISHVGGSVTIKCYYLTTTANRHGRKYWCKESQRACQTIISSNHFTHQDYRGRVSINDWPQKGILQVTMTQLEKKDSSNYRCGIGRTNNGLYAGVNLTIWEGLNVPASSEILWGQLRGSVTIQCPSGTTSMKSLCKLRRSSCTPIVDTNRNNVQGGRITFTAEDSSGTFNVSINKLRREDSGIYKCGTRMHDSNADGKIIQLQVIEESVFSNILSVEQITYEPQTTCTPSHRHVTSTNEVHQEGFSKTDQDLLPIVIPVPVLLVLAAVVITVLIKIRQRRKNASSYIPERNFEREIPLSSQKSSEEHLKEKNRDSGDEQETAVGPGKAEVPVTSVYCLINKTPNTEDSREND